MLIFLGLVILAVLFVTSAFWSSAETALTSLSKYRIKKLIALNKSMSAPLGQWLRSPYYLLTTILVGNTLTDLFLSYLGTYLVLQVFAPFLSREIIEFITWLGITFLLLIFGEVTPKIFSRHNPEKVTLFILPFLSRFMEAAIILIGPAVRVIKWVAPQINLVPVGRLSYLSLEEIRGLITEVNTTGNLGADASRMLEGVLRLGELNAAQIMTPVDKIEAVNINQGEERFLDLAVETGRSRVPVYYGTIDRIAGFVHTKDLLWCWKSRNGAFSRDIIRPPYFVASDKKVSDLLREFQAGKTHMAFVKDVFGNLAGLVTLEDILEAIMGEILDEYDIKKAL
jgi:CBS domain containing-hemolysin-like protein